MRELLPGMLVRPDELVDSRTELEIALIADDEIEVVNGLLAASFEAPVELFEEFSNAVQEVDEARWYVGRADGEFVSTALGFTLGGATGIFGHSVYRRLGFHDVEEYTLLTRPPPN